MLRSVIGPARLSLIVAVTLCGLSVARGDDAIPRAVPAGPRLSEPPARPSPRLRNIGIGLTVAGLASLAGAIPFFATARPVDDRPCDSRLDDSCRDVNLDRRLFHVAGVFLLVVGGG